MENIENKQQQQLPNLNELQFNATNNKRINRMSAEKTPFLQQQNNGRQPSVVPRRLPRNASDLNPSRISENSESDGHHSEPENLGKSFKIGDSQRQMRGFDTTPPSSVAATGRPGSDAGSHVSRDNASIRSWASVGMGSTDGKKMIIRRVPTTPVELFNIVNPPT